LVPQPNPAFQCSKSLYLQIQKEERLKERERRVAIIIGWLANEARRGEGQEPISTNAKKLKNLLCTPGTGDGLLRQYKLLFLIF
jgi:hypothetical protein